MYSQFKSGVKRKRRLGSRCILIISGPDEDCRVFCISEESSEGPRSRGNFIFRRPRRFRSLPSCGASLWLGVEDFLDLTALL